jgi:hypothetical protein
MFFILAEAVPESIAQKTKMLADFYLEQMKSELSDLMREQEKKIEEKCVALQSHTKTK